MSEQRGWTIRVLSRAEGDTEATEARSSDRARE